MFNLNDTLQYDSSKDFKEQTPEVKSYIYEIYSQEGFYVLPLEYRQEVATNGKLPKYVTYINDNCETIFDIFARPVVVTINKGNFIIKGERFYIEKSTIWRMKNEKITVYQNE